MSLKLYLGCGPKPFHKQHYEIIDDTWTFVDLYVNDPDIKKWDATKLDEVKDGSVDAIYSSHLLEHISHVRTHEILSLWRDKLTVGGELILNVPDFLWIAEKTIHYVLGKKLEGYYTEWNGEHGLQSVIYGSQSHDGEYHKAGFIKDELEKMLKRVGFKDVQVAGTYDAHDMGVLVAKCKK